MNVAIRPTRTLGVPRARDLWLLAPIGAIGAAVVLRFGDLGGQSLWVDEALTTRLLDGSLGDLLSGVADRETTPPLYYVLVWAWAKLLGSGEAAVRSLSALCGVACVPVMYLVARELSGRRAAAMAAALTATSTTLVWYSQETRSYSLWLLLTALALLFWIRAVETPARRDLAWWSVASALALCTHYLAFAFIVPQAAWLLRRHLGRATLAAVGGVTLVALALVPLALHQRGGGGTDWISALPVDQRLKHTYWQFTTGANSSWDGAVPIVALLAEGALVLALLHGPARVRRGVLVPLALAASSLLIVLAGGLLGYDYLFARNVLLVLLLLIVAVAAVAGSPGKAGVAGVAIGLAIGVLFVRQDVRLDTTPSLQRDDWRGAAAALGPSAEPRVIALVPGWTSPVLEYYVPDLEPMSAPRAVREIDYVIPYSASGEPPRAPAGFVVEADRPVQNWRFRVLRLRAQRPTRVDPQSLSTPGFEGYRAFTQGG